MILKFCLSLFGWVQTIHCYLKVVYLKFCCIILQKFYLWLKKLVESESDFTMLDVQVIHLAAALGYNVIIQNIIGAANIDINLGGKNGCTALHWAAKFGR